jgi:NarL family two-component system response regulator LiaR
MATLKSIIIVEDHPLMAQGLAAYFEGTGRWQVIGCAATLDEAKGLLEQGTVDVALLDIQLKEGWGLDIIPWLAEQEMPLPTFAVYTSFDDYTHASAAMSMGVKAYVSKRRSVEELETAIIQALDGDIYLDSAAQFNIKAITDCVKLLSKREAEILTRIKTGLTNAQIAEQLGISRRTVENHVSFIYEKTGIQSRRELENL